MNINIIPGLPLLQFLLQHYISVTYFIQLLVRFTNKKSLKCEYKFGLICIIKLLFFNNIDRPNCLKSELVFTANISPYLTDSNPVQIGQSKGYIQLPFHRPLFTLQKDKTLHLTARICNHIPANSLIPACTVHHPLASSNNRFTLACLPDQEAHPHSL